MIAHVSDIAASVAQYGWTAVGVQEHQPPFVYSVGLIYSADHPEIVIAGLPDDGCALLKYLVKLLVEGRSFAKPGVYDDALEGVRLAVRPVHPTQHAEFLGYAISYCHRQRDFGRLAAVQVFWPDDAGRFPFDDDCDPAVCERQPRLDLEARACDLAAGLSA